VPPEVLASPGPLLRSGSDPQAIDLDGLLLRLVRLLAQGMDNGIMHEPPVRIFVMGDNVWRDEQAWPLARAQAVQYYLHSQGRPILHRQWHAESPGARRGAPR